MSFHPEYGETLLTEEELGALTPQARDLLGHPLRKADLYDLEQGIQQQVADNLVGQVFEGALSTLDLLTDHFVRELHRLLYGQVWTWGGRHRVRETNLGMAPERIAVEMRNAMDDLRFRWEHGGLAPRPLGVEVHAALVRIHPFVDGNGRVTRLMADLVFLSAQNGDALLAYDWDVERRRYIEVLREYDLTRDPTRLVEFIPVFVVEEDD